MAKIHIDYSGVYTCIEYPDSFQPLIDILYPEPVGSHELPETVRFEVKPGTGDVLSLYEQGVCLAENSTPLHIAVKLSQEVVRSVAERYQRHLAIHAAAVAQNGKAIIVPAQTGRGKTSLSAWLTISGYDYLTDELVLFRDNQGNFDALYRPLNVKASGIDAIRELTGKVGHAEQFTFNGITLLPADELGNRVSPLESILAGLFLFPVYREGSDVVVEGLTAAQAGLELMSCNVNARNLEGHGFSQCTALARTVPAMRLTYGEFSQLDGFLPELIELLVTGSLRPGLLNRLTRPVAAPAAPPGQKSAVFTVPEASASGARKKLCIGMATYDDYDGVYFTSQAVRLYHPEVTGDTEILVLDNHPDGRCSKDLKSLDRKIANYRYVPVQEKTGTAIRDLIFEHANSDFVLCMDCHVFIEPGSIKKLLAYFDADPDCRDLLQGPMYYDDLSNLTTHFRPVWNQGMYGVWGMDERGRNPDNPAFDIPMQGLGLFACRRDAWPGFNTAFRGFGGEEGYIHEKFRRAGGRTLCLPFLRWLHRFARPLGVPYPINWPDRIRNYLIGFSELGLDTAPVIEHFNEHVGEGMVHNTSRDIEQEFGVLPGCRATTG